MIFKDGGNVVALPDEPTQLMLAAAYRIGQMDARSGMSPDGKDATIDRVWSMLCGLNAKEPRDG